MCELFKLVTCDRTPKGVLVLALHIYGLYLWFVNWLQKPQTCTLSQLVVYFAPSITSWCTLQCKALQLGVHHIDPPR